MSALRVGLCSALTDTVCDALRQAGIRTANEFVIKDVEDLVQKSGVSYKDLQAIRRVVLAQYSSFPQCGLEVYTSALTSIAILPTGCPSIDTLLDGGLYTGELTEIAGQTAVGKTQFCFSCCVSVACDTKQSVLYLDTCGSFTAERLADIITAQDKEQEVDEALTRVRYHRVSDIFQLLERLEEIKLHLSKQTDQFYSSLKLVIVDNVASVLYPVLGGRHMDGLGLMSHLGLKLKILAVDFSIAVLITNNVASEGARVSLGKTWSHVPHTRLFLSRRHDVEGRPVRDAKVVKSNKMDQAKTEKTAVIRQDVQTPDPLSILS
ncbi:hypothetical protein ScPMuIL_005286 [Solemya velum]